MKHTGIHYTSYFTESDSVSCLADFVVLGDYESSSCDTVHNGYNVIVEICGCRVSVGWTSDFFFVKNMGFVQHLIEVC